METVWRIEVDRLAKRWLLPLPAGALIICIIVSLLFNFEQSTYTHCKEVEVLVLFHRTERFGSDN